MTRNLSETSGNTPSSDDEPEDDHDSDDGEDTADWELPPAGDMLDAAVENMPAQVEEDEAEPDRYKKGEQVEFPDDDRHVP